MHYHGRMEDPDRLGLAEVLAELKTLGAQRKGAHTLLERTEERMKALIRRAAALEVSDVDVGELVDYSRSQRLLIRRGLTRHPGGPKEERS